ncbi:SUKH-4 family immunity protein [Streptomyces sp. NPDC101150]|uniref:SUKH-4 family immunity protein n=1 Tax=Streptomyces sp. NPDC101150 TaxID=3366114 RepID=UPI003822D93A
MNQPSSPGDRRLSPDEAIARVLEWWNDGNRTARRCEIVGGRDADDLLREVHRRAPRSLLLDATGRTADEVVTEVLDFVGAPDSARTGTPWRRLRKYFSADTLILLTNVHRAGRTRHSARPAQVRGQLAQRLSHQRRTGVVVAAPSESGPPAPEFVLRLDGPDGVRPHADPDQVPAPIRALALAEPRRVPLPVWRELSAAGGLNDVDEVALEDLAVRFPDLVTVGSGCAAFVDEGLAEALREATAPEWARQVNRHLVEWLRGLAPRLRHPEGWGASGDLGRYAAEGLAAHAVRAGLFEELLTDGGTLANLTLEALLDAAHCADDGSVPGNSPAADAVHLWSYGVAPRTQPEWAAWLHLMATAREDTAVAAGIADSGVRLPWTTSWAHWRPPGGYHPRYLRPGPVDDLYGVHWQGRPAVAVEAAAAEHLHVRDVATGELLGGPWHEGDLPEDARRALTWTDPGAHDSHGPAALSDFEDADRADEGPDEELLHVALTVGNRVVVAGAGGLFAVEPAEPAAFQGLEAPRGLPLSDCPTVAGPTRPLHAPDPAPTDLAELFDEPAIVRTPEDSLPAGLTDDAARRALSGCGLPVMDARGLALEPDSPEFLSEATWADDLESPTTPGPFFTIGRWMGGPLVVDGPTGVVLRMPAGPGEDGLEGTLVASGLEPFLTMAAHWITGRQILDVTENETEAHLLRQHIEDALWTIDWRGSTAGAWIYPLHND